MLREHRKMNTKMMQNEIIDIDLEPLIDKYSVDNNAGYKPESFQRGSAFGFCKSVKFIQSKC